MSQQTNRILYLDILRIIAGISIIAHHALYPHNLPLSDAIRTSLIFALDFAPGIFCMISGACLLGTATPTKNFLKKRYSKILPILFIWTIIYLLLYNFVKGELPRTFNLYLLSALFETQVGHLWFIYTICGLYLLTPILNRWIAVASKKELQFYLAIWVLVSTFPLIDKYLVLNHLPYFEPWFFHFSGYVGFYLLGFYLHTYKTCSYTKAIVSLCIATAVLAANICKGWDYICLENAGIGSICLVYAIFSLAQKSLRKPLPKTRRTPNYITTRNIDIGNLHDSRCNRPPPKSIPILQIFHYRSINPARHIHNPDSLRNNHKTNLIPPTQQIHRRLPLTNKKDKSLTKSQKFVSLIP